MPDADVALDATLPPCATCGNGRLEVGETCDDGNVEAGDGCSAECQDEGCIAQTPGYPAVPLCEDGNPCTADACQAAQCAHLPDDSAACDDGNPCTAGDYCQGGWCTASDLVPFQQLRLVLTVADGTARDRLKLRGDGPYLDGVDPSLAGLWLELRDSTGSAVYQAMLPAEAWRRSGKGAAKFRYRDPRASIAGVRAAVVKLDPGKARTRVVLRAGGVELDQAAASDSLGGSVVFGDTPASDPCLSATGVQCQHKGRKVRCQ